MTKLITLYNFKKKIAIICFHVKFWDFFLCLVVFMCSTHRYVDWVFRWFKMDFGFSLTWLAGDICGGIWSQLTKMLNWRALKGLFFFKFWAFVFVSCGIVLWKRVYSCIPTSILPCLWVQECLVDKRGKRTCCTILINSAFC